MSIAELPERVIDKGIPGASLLAMMLTGKYADHLPLYRQKQIFARENIQIATSTIEGWTRQALEKLAPLYLQLVHDTRTQGYLQVDETRIKVLDSDKKGAAHTGWYWVYHAPLDGTVVYEKYGKKKDITHLACWAHARREFERAYPSYQVHIDLGCIMF